MAFILVSGARTWGGSRDSDGYTTYKVKWLVRGETTDGPAAALLTPGLPVYGTPWAIDNDVDLWAWCRWDATMTPYYGGQEGEPGKYFLIEQTFSSKPPDDKKCKDNQPTDPLLEPQKISGSFVKYTEEATYDRFGDPIENSSFEQIRGPQNEWDKNRPQVRIEQNVPSLQIALLAQMQDTLNDATLWGLPKRCIKLSDVSWERKFYGSCYVYYTRNLTFDIRYETFDRDLLDEGTKVLRSEERRVGKECRL